ncbi:hypothetical protein [Halovivax cerinus]|uniref:Uncharacterized protein n=1 Tax=Halovivax cerinus TaxID=1487865 RepID=A0ABD5NS61_9EURY|nr:hypothetical protein [Halovivax cerinus]
MSDPRKLQVSAFVDDPTDNLVRRAIERLHESGFETDWNRAADQVHWYEVGSFEDGRETRNDSSFDTVGAEIAAAKSGVVRTEFADRYALVTFTLDADERYDELAPVVHVDGITERAFESNEVSAEPARERAETVEEAVVALAEALDPWYLTVSIRHIDELMGLHPDEHPPNSGLEELGWMTVFSEEWFPGFGGRDRVLDAPVWKAAELDTGAVFLRTDPVPGHVRPDLSGDHEVSAYEYLFEGRSVTELRAEIDRKRSTFVDPFRELEPGELASDPVVCEAHAPFEFEGMDYGTFPDDLDYGDRCHVFCVRRRDDRLWEVNSETFIRRLVDEDGLPIGELPADVPPDEEMISLAVGTAYEGDLSLDLYRMDAPDEPSVHAQLLGLSTIPEDGQLWHDEE